MRAFKNRRRLLRRAIFYRRNTSWNFLTGNWKSCCFDNFRRPTKSWQDKSQKGRDASFFGKNTCLFFKAEDLIATKKTVKTIDDENFCRNVCRLLSEDESLSVFVLDLNGRICGHGSIAHWSVGDVRMFPVCTLLRSRSYSSFLVRQRWWSQQPFTKYPKAPSRCDYYRCSA